MSDDEKCYPKCTCGADKYRKMTKEEYMHKMKMGGWTYGTDYVRKIAIKTGNPHPPWKWWYLFMP